MPIGLPTSRSRLKVIWVGDPIPDASLALLKRLRYLVHVSPKLGSLDDDGSLAGTAAVVFSQPASKPLQTIIDLEAHASRLIDHDCLVFVLATAAGLTSVQNVLKHLEIPAIWPTSGPDFGVFDGRKEEKVSDAGEPPFPHVRVYRTPYKEEEIAQILLRYSPLHAPAAASSNLFNLTGPASSSLSPDEKMMLRRAFFDCSQVHIKKMEGGRSGVCVFLAHALLALPRLGPRPLPFFVKIGERRKIIQEWMNYGDRVRQYVPFHLGPHLVQERCALGAYSGIIVGDFVEDSESLHTCSRDARASTPIGTLFDRTLRGWHLQARKEHRSLYFSRKQLLAGSIPPGRLQRAKKLGACRTPGQIRQILAQREKEWMLWGPIHGDLHASNARVRGNDAILIDFYCTSEGPLIEDPAALEVSLLIRAPLDKGFDSVGWKTAVADLYQRDALRWPPVVSDPTRSYAWITSSVRQIRLHALAMERERGQYATMLAYRLFHAATKDPDAGHAEETRRTTAYYLADRLLDMKW